MPSLSLSGKVWHNRGGDAQIARAICQHHGLHAVIGDLLAARGVAVEAVPGFLTPRLRDSLPDPSHLNGMDTAVARLADAVEAGEAVGILGDYDVDGATSVALLARYLRTVGTSAHVDIPDRLTEGYGPNTAAFARLAGHGCRLIATLDSGTTAFAALAGARAAGLEIVVVDHHAAEAELPDALAVINPNRRDQASDCGDLAAVGVVFLLVIALNRELRQRGWFVRRDEPDLLQWLDLVALGTVCDVVSLTGLNRALVAQGLLVMERKRNPGLEALAAIAKMEGRPSTFHLGFLLGPRINAGGRIGPSSLAARLLMEDDQAEARAIATLLDEFNRRRRSLEGTVTTAAANVAREQDDTPVIVVAGEGWHPGVIGIVASRLVERFGRPVLVIGTADGVGKGSGRSVPGFDLGDAVIAARRAGILTQGGGHPMAAGLTIDAGRVGELRAFMAERAAAAWERGEAPPRRLDVDAELALGGLHTDLAEVLENLAPFGPGNPEPCFQVSGVRVVQARGVGNDHVSCRLVDSAGAGVRAIAFRCRAGPVGQALMDAQGMVFRAAGRLKLDTYQGNRRLAFHIEDLAHDQA